MKVVKSNVIMAGVLAAALLLGGCSNNTTSSNSSSSTSSVSSTASAKTITITDDMGNQVTVPTNVKRVVDGYPFHSETLAILGAASKEVGSINSAKTLPWLYKVVPAYNKVPTVFTSETEANVEEIVKLKPDVVFLAGQKGGNPLAAQLKKAGIPAVQISFQDIAGMKKSITMTAEVLGGSAVARGEKLNNYLDSQFAKVTKVTSTIPDSQKPSVLHFCTQNPLTVDGTGSLMDYWIKAAGGKNAATVAGSSKEVTAEQVLQWNPDIIIAGRTHDNGFAASDSAATVYSNTVFASLNAVKNKRVVDNPIGAFLWDRFGPEEGLQVVWAAKTFHPDLFKDINLNRETKNFYKTFLNYSLTDSDVNKILAAQAPSGNY